MGRKRFGFFGLFQANFYWDAYLLITGYMKGRSLKGCKLALKNYSKVFSHAK